MMQGTDRSSIVGKLAPPAMRVEVLVVGAGPAGIAAAAELAGAGVAVMLVDENPIEGGLIGMDVPHFFGGRASGAVQNKARMLEQIFASEPALEAAMAAGADLQLGVGCWGVFLPGPATRELPGPIAGLSDGERVWTVGFDRAVLATGARDLVIFFEGADLPGVMGAAALRALLTRYDAFDGRRLVIFGSDDHALATAELALERGLEVAALIEADATPRGGADRVAALADRGVAIHCNSVILSAEGGPSGVTGVRIAPIDGGDTWTIACDTVCLALGLVPVVELFDAAGVAVAVDPARGGFVPASADGVSTRSPLIFGAGDCMGVSRHIKTVDEVQAHGRRAARAVLASLGRADAAPPAAAPAPDDDQLGYRLRVMEAMLSAGGAEVPACQCEDVTTLRSHGRQGAPLSGTAGREECPPGSCRPDGGRAAEPRPDEAPHPRLDGPLSGAPLPGAGRHADGAWGRRAGRVDPARRLSRAGAAAPARRPGLDRRDRSHERRLGGLVQHRLAMDPFDLIGTDAEATFVDDHTLR